MSDFIEEFYCGNIEPQECTTNLTSKVKKTLSELAGKEEQLTSLLTDKTESFSLTMLQPTSNFQASVTQTVSLSVSDSEHASHTTLLSITRKDEHYGKHYIQTSQ